MLYCVKCHTLWCKVPARSPSGGIPFWIGIYLRSHRSHRSHRFISKSRRNKRNKRNYLNSILSDDKFIFYLNHSENMFSRCFRENINLCSHEQSSLSKRLSSGRIYRFLSVKICEICVTFKNISFISFLSAGLLKNLCDL